MPTLDQHLSAFALGDPGRAALAGTIRALAEAAVSVRNVIALAAPGGFAASGAQNAGGDAQHVLDLHADEVFLAAARRAGVAHYCSEELDGAVALNPRPEARGETGAGDDGGLAVAIDPLDGSSGIDVNVSVGTIFSILPAAGGEPAASFLRPGREQLAAGFFVYGPQLALALTLGEGTRIFVHAPHPGGFVEVAHAAVPERTQEFAVNASNYRHWDEAVRLYVDDCLKGAAGPREKDFNMRWIASLVAEAYRILMRGGVFLYPSDARRGYAQGRLRLVYEANPVAMLVEQAGGAATDGISRILDIQPHALHQRTPLVFGSAREVARIGRYHTEPSVIAERSPLFGNRGLFRA